MTREEYIEKIKLLNYYTSVYDDPDKEPEISDEEWDDIYFECAQYEEETGYIDPASPTSSISYENKTKLKKITHNHLMLSLSKTKSVDEMKKFLKEKSLCMFKMDGLTCSLTYENGKLISAETRGNGKIGEDITENAKRLPSIPKTIATKDRTVVDGEVICKYDDFEEFSDSFKNPRNFASGSIKLDDPDECEKRKLTFVAWDKITGTEDLDVKLIQLASLNFIVVDWEYADVDNLEEQQQRMRKKAAQKNYPIDGLVYKINDYQSYMAKGYNDHDFAGGKAFKFYDELFETTLIDIEWSVGKTGNVTPVAIFNPVQIDGTIVQRASMHNISIMKELLGEKPFIGQKIWVIKANCIIPQVLKAERNN